MANATYHLELTEIIHVVIRPYLQACAIARLSRSSYPFSEIGIPSGGRI